MNAHTFDAVIVGAGPAGLASGIALATQGCKVMVCDQRALPADKPCGEGIMPTGVAELQRLGVLPALRRDRCHPFSGVSYFAPSGRVAAARFAEGPGLGVRRTELSRALLERAQSIPTLTLRAPALVTRRKNTRELEIAVEGEPLRMRLLIGADGLHSRVRKWAGLARRSRGAKRWGIRRHFAIEPWSDHVEVHFSAEAEAYVTPTGPTETGITLLWDPTRLRVAGGRHDSFCQLLRRFPSVERLLSTARPVSAPHAIGPMLQPTRGIVSDGVLLVGDAAGYVDALTGEGVSLALLEAAVLSTAVAPLLREDPGGAMLLRTALVPYARRVNSMTRTYRLLTQALLFLGRRPWLVESAVATLSRRPSIMQHLLSVNMGQLPAWHR